MVCKLDLVVKSLKTLPVQSVVSFTACLRNKEGEKDRDIIFFTGG